MKKFLCLWSDRPNQWQDVKVVEGFGFFNDANGYDDAAECLRTYFTTYDEN